MKRFAIHFLRKKFPFIKSFLSLLVIFILMAINGCQGNSPQSVSIKKISSSGIDSPAGSGNGNPGSPRSILMGIQYAATTKPGPQSYQLILQTQLSGKTATVYFTQSHFNATSSLNFYDQCEQQPGLCTVVQVQVLTGNLISTDLSTLGSYRVGITVLDQSATAPIFHYTDPVNQTVQSSSSGNGTPPLAGVPIVPNCPDGKAAFALVAVPNDSGQVIAKSRLQASVPAQVADAVNDATAFLALPFTPDADINNPGTLGPPRLAQNNALTRYPRQSSGQTAMTRPTHIALMNWIADLQPGNNFFAFCKVAANDPIYTSLLQANPFQLHAQAQALMSDLTIRFLDPSGIVYTSKPCQENQKVYYSGPVTLDRECNGITRSTSSSGMPHAVAVKVHAVVASNSSIVDLHVAIMNGFTVQKVSGGWNNLSSKSNDGMSNKLYAQEVTLEFPNATSPALQFDQLDEGRYQLPQDLTANGKGLRILHSGEPGRSFLIKDFHFLDRHVYVGSTGDAASLALIASQPMTGIVMTSKSIAGQALNSFNEIPLYSNYRISRSDPQGNTPASFDQNLKGQYQSRISNMGQPEQNLAFAKLGNSPFVIFKYTASGGTTGGTGVEGLSINGANTIRGMSIWGLRFLESYYRDLVDQQIPVFFNGDASDPRAFDVWRADYGLIQKYSGDSTFYQPLSQNWDLSTSLFPNMCCYYWLMGRDTFAALPAYTQHEQAAKANIVSWNNFWDNTYGVSPHDRAHSVRNRPAHMACLILGMPNACFAVRAIAGNAYQARTNVPLDNTKQPFGNGGYGLSLVNDKHDVYHNGGGHGGIAVGRNLAWTTMEFAFGMALETDDAALNYMEQASRDEIQYELMATIPNLLVPGVMGKSNQDMFDFIDGSGKASAYYGKNWQFNLMNTATTHLRSYFENSPDHDDQKATIQATQTILNFGIFTNDLIWSPQNNGPWMNSAMSGFCTVSYNCYPAVFQTPNPSSTAVLYVDDDPNNQAFYRNNSIDSYYCGDSLAILAVETSSVSATNKVQGLKNKNSNDYNSAFSQYYWWNVERGILP